MHPGPFLSFNCFINHFLRHGGCALRQASLRGPRLLEIFMFSSFFPSACPIIEPLSSWFAALRTVAVGLDGRRDIAGTLGPHSLSCGLDPGQLTRALDGQPRRSRIPDADPRPLNGPFPGDVQIHCSKWMAILVLLFASGVSNANFASLAYSVDMLWVRDQ